MSAAERRGAARTAVVWDDLREVLADAGAVVDIGGGTGGFAVPVAERGHRVTVVDPSPDALAALARRAAESGVADRVVGVQGDLHDLADVIEPGSADLVLCHGVLEVLPDPSEALAKIHDVLRPGGALSLVVAQRHAAVLARAMAGHFAQALALLDGGEDPEPGRGVRRRFTADEVVELLRGVGFTPGDPHGVRVFADLVPGSLLDLEPGGHQALVALEAAVAQRREFLPLAAQVHVLATR
ncbi:methyltransferase domain-containing protein [Nocardioides alcanivorans]|uniref:methyltransferase domain-containing protein n=1 Tax=Nocardioides alcanivorans TaxID=2897352 RepID=UPI001F2A12D4|nr:methyltransferase domain-containing protein [Nocardioides alcanivorans]